MTKLREIKLIKLSNSLDSLNQPITTETSRTVTVEVRSVSRSEYFQGRQGGLTPDLSFLLSVFDYDGERIIEHNATRYAIYRTYETDDNYIELYAQVEGGITNVTPPPPPTPTPEPEPEPTPEPEPDEDEGGDVNV